VATWTIVHFGEQVAKHNTQEDCWISVNGIVYDITKFLPEHPGGSEVVMECTGQLFLLPHALVVVKLLSW
jgi:cytochrome b involved in lipid metabolism